MIALLVAESVSAKPLQNALQEQETWKVTLPKGSQPEGIAAGSEHDLWVACLSGNIIHVVSLNHLTGSQGRYGSIPLSTACLIMLPTHACCRGSRVFATHSTTTLAIGSLLNCDFLVSDYDAWLLQDLATNTSTVVHKERNVHLSGVKFCKKQQVLFVAGTLSGKGYVYHMQREIGPAGAQYMVGQREVLDLHMPGSGYINDVTLSQDRAYFTDSFNPVLYWVPRFYSPPVPPENEQQQQQRFGIRLGSNSNPNSRPVSKVSTGNFFDTKAGQFRANGLAVYKSNEHRDVLLVANTHTGHLYKVVVDKTADGDAKDAPAKQPGGGVATVAAVKPAGGVSRIAQQATMAVASRLRLGRFDNTAAPAGTPQAAQGHQKTGAKVAAAKHSTASVAGARQGVGGAGKAATTAAMGSIGPQRPNQTAVPPASGASQQVKWSKLAADVADELKKHQKAEQQQQPQAHPKKAGVWSKLAKNVASRMRLAGSAAGGAAAGNTHTNSSSWQPDVLLAEPVQIHESTPDINPAATAAAAAAAAVAAVSAQHSRALGRSLLAVDAAAAKQAAWPAQMARGIAGRLGFPAREKQTAAAVVQELPLPAIAGQYTQRILVDGVAIKDDFAYVADNYNNRVWGVDLDKGLSAVHIKCGFQGPVMHVPTTLAFQSGRLWWVNAHLDTCFPFLPCPAHQFELYGVLPSRCQEATL